MKNSLLGLMAGIFGRLFSKSLKADRDTAGRLEFKTSTQRLGLTFTQKIRDTFRYRWLKRR